MLRDPERLGALLLDESSRCSSSWPASRTPPTMPARRSSSRLSASPTRPDVRHRIAFLPDYDMSMARLLYWGCDVWLNNPLRPLEACGTSGMKSALNGGLNLSIRDGWWDEWYDGENGWEIPTADGLADEGRRDDLEASALYNLLENSVGPEFYDRDDDGVPTSWWRWSATPAVAGSEGAGLPDGAGVHRSTTHPPPRRCAGPSLHLDGPPFGAAGTGRHRLRAGRPGPGSPITDVDSTGPARHPAARLTPATLTAAVQLAA